MSIESKKDEHKDGAFLHRWSCLVCETKGIWHRDSEVARQAMRTHRQKNPRHLERLRERAARLGLADEVKP